MKSLRNLFLAIPLLALVGCGCNSDEFFRVTPNPTSILPFVIGSRIPPIPVPPVNAPKRIDVFFLMDDSGIAPNQPGGIASQAGMVYGDLLLDTRDKQITAQAVFQDMVTKLKADLTAAYPGETFDLAFGVGRYEDFGGPFQTTDALARPFILNQPILRQDRLDFTTLFTPALQRIAPGHGNNPANPMDPQSVVEALFQIGSGAGFDGDGGGKDGSGAVGALQTQINPGTSGDVPAAAFTASVADDDGQPGFATPGGALASGNLGGVGWRPDSLRYVITTSDIASVSPFPSGAPIPATITSTDGGAYPRDPKAIPSQAFAANAGTVAQQATGRFGVVPAPVAPATAASVQTAVDALNGLNIEVLSIGMVRSAPIPFKPNLPGATFPAIAAIPNPSTPDFSPFTWMSAFALLTGAERPWPPVNPTGNLPLVYNLPTVFPANNSVTADVREDLVYRVGQGLSTLPGNVPGVLTPAEYVISASIATGPGSPFTLGAVTPIDTDGAGTAVVVQGSNLLVRIPRYAQGGVAPAAIEVQWLVQIQQTDAFQLGALSDTLPFSFAGAVVPGQNPVPPALGPNSGNAFYSVPARADETQVLGSAILANATAGCVFVADQNGGNRSQGGSCP